MALIKKFVDLHGGRVWVESKIEKGSSFTFELPLKWRKTPEKGVNEEHANTLEISEKTFRLANEKSVKENSLKAGTPEETEMPKS
ncbi:MAG TPA: hypothetical protein HA306_10660 [Methanosarcina sp.]|nr:hypothetical protein [Methanosarcina sp.]